MVTVFTGRPTGGEDRKYVLDAHSGRLISEESYADKPFLYRCTAARRSAPAGLSSRCAGALPGMVDDFGLTIYWRMRRKNAVGLQKVFW